MRRNIVTRRGMGVTLVCLGRNVESIDTMAVWKFKGQDVKDSVKKRASEMWLSGGRGNFSLHIANVSDEDVGKYTCSVHVSNFNKADVAEGVVKLKLYDSGMFIITYHSVRNDRAGEIKGTIICG